MKIDSKLIKWKLIQNSNEIDAKLIISALPYKILIFRCCWPLAVAVDWCLLLFCGDCFGDPPLEEWWWLCSGPCKGTNWCINSTCVCKILIGRLLSSRSYKQIDFDNFWRPYQDWIHCVPTIDFTSLWDYKINDWLRIDYIFPGVWL